MPVICTGGFQTALGHRRGDRARRLRRGEHRAAAHRQQRSGRGLPARAGPRRSPVHLLQHAAWSTWSRIRSAATTRSRYPSREAMLAEIMSVFNPPAVSAVIDRAGERTMADDLLGRDCGDLLNRRPWYELPRLLAMGRLVEMRNELREKNLHDTEEPAVTQQAIPANLDPALRESAHRRRHQQRSAVPEDGRGRPPLRPQRPARAHVAGHRQPARAQPARRQPRADDARRVPAGDDPEPAGGGVDSVHGARLVRAQALEDRVARDPDAAGDDFGAPTITRADDGAASRRRPDRRGRPPTPT